METASRANTACQSCQPVIFPSGAMTTCSNCVGGCKDCQDAADSGLCYGWLDRQNLKRHKSLAIGKQLKAPLFQRDHPPWNMPAAIPQIHILLDPNEDLCYSVQFHADELFVDDVYVPRDVLF
ncbi:hypothetical protein MKZ38_006861 [Zalerion maritima]|uniref:Uncharacterized protein n=1 Tax=Zalerion maritima TaxID=339359 RepID=A0AAD5WNJ0_9PEZI|nr:hypothetical protein MKZ38_006861 [Zalerion maritima]